ncbi:MAG TPA: UDP-glucose/GDP-mannose dehydrogenase family protein [Candidatus Krumholzibacteria bacterium]|nr:UDP-glucose/GDP-mannose dehydrogenase family protein [Candidatus Krumholzibacteria bacterium]HPD70969.1 UDP-glucose/GDP-mannose dehydrogenase family protein [Candidatus Krumholzibacteria bacterium]HRY39331.1 UDP-glucose/GDP-mannose dehydrogenase family protein [Candidatus Krumholzibacteria bacterium]
MRICMIGTGYVGLVSGACLADFGHRVTCVDILADRIAAIERGEMPFYEPGLDVLVAKNVREERLSFTTDLATGMRGADVVFIAVQTPQSENSGEADLTYVWEVGKQIGQLLDSYKVVVTKSTVPVGTARKLQAIIRAALPAPVEFDMASNPEFLREGSSIEDFMRPDRVVIGTESPRAEALMRAIYRPLFLLDTPIFHCPRIETAELIKYASNSFLAVKISFINEIAAIAERVGADVSQIAKAMGLDRRIGGKFLHAGLGYGGSCFPKDTHALCHIAREHGERMSIVEAAVAVNAGLPERAIAKARDLLGDFAGKTVALLGLSFKPNTDDIRCAGSRPIARRLLDGGARLRVHDPVAMDNYRRVFPEPTYCKSAYDACEGADLAILVTEWNEYRQLDFDHLGEIMKARRLLDCRNVYSRELVAPFGFTYRSFGRPELADHEVKA